MSELYELPPGWEWKKLGDIAKIIGGGTPKRNLNEYWENGNIVWLSPTDLGKIGEIIEVSTSKDNITQLGLDKSSAKLLPVGTVLYSSRATIGKIAINSVEVSTNQGFSNFICNDELFNKYLAYCLNRFTTDITSLSNSTTFKEVSKSSLKEFEIPLPPLTQQQRIVTKLNLLFEKIDKSIALHQKNMAEADVFMGSVLNDVFGELEESYKKRTLESFNKKMSSGGTPSRKEKAYWNGTIEWFSSGELNQLYTLPSKEKITQLGLDNTSAKLFSKGTLLIGMYDTAAMKMSILSNAGSCNQAIVGFKPKEDELNIFFAKYQLQYLKKEILEQRQGVRQQNLNLSKIKNVQIEYPPLTIQQRIVSYLDEISEKIEKVESVQKEKMESLKALKASILDRAFRGEL